MTLIKDQLLKAIRDAAHHNPDVQAVTVAKCAKVQTEVSPPISRGLEHYKE